MATKPNKNYSISPAKIGNQDGFRLPRAFSKDYPHLVAAGGYVEVLDDNTLLVRLDPNETSEEEEHKDVQGQEHPEHAKDQQSHEGEVLFDSLLQGPHG